MTTILLLRHGESEGNAERRFGGHGPTPLSERGRAQARAVGRVLSAEPKLDAIYASDLARAVETATLVREGLGGGAPTGIVETPALRERSVGIFTGMTFEEARAQYPEEYAALLRRDPNLCPPGGETHAACRTRAVEFFDQVAHRHAGGRVLLVSHNLTIYHLLRHVLGLTDNPQAPLVFFQIDNCALHRFEQMSTGIWKVITLNERVREE